MSNTAFKRDIHDPQAVRDFVEIVQSPERLRLLLCLTVADIRAVGPNIWNNWKATLLRELYYRAEEALSGALLEHSTASRVEAAQAALRKELGRLAGRGYRGAVRARLSGLLAVGRHAETQARHARFMRQAERDEAPISLDTRIDRARGVSEITIYTADHPGLFSHIAGAMALAGANIVGAQIFTMSNGMALDTFMIQEALASDRSSTAFERPERLAKLAALIEQVLSGRLRLRDALAKRTAPPLRMAAFTAPPRVVIDNKASATHTLIEINGADRPGLLFNVTNALTELGLSIGTAKIATYGERVVDVFYVKDVFGHKIDEERKLARIRERVLAALADPNAKARPAPTVRRRRAGAAAAE